LSGGFVLKPSALTQYYPTIRIIIETNMYQHDDPNILWVSAAFEGRGNGTFDSPHNDITRAVESARPGNTVVLKAGRYAAGVSIQNSGTITRPIRIVAEEENGSEVCCLSSWFLYDVSDVIISGITFRDVTHQAISSIGACKRNSFSNLRFFNCGLSTEASCTLFFGGSGAECNVVQSCVFEVDPERCTDLKEGLPIAVMITEGDTDEFVEPNKDHIFRRNSFAHYGSAVVAGTRDNHSGIYSHIIENNTIQNCSGDGIRIKCGDTIVRGNVLQKCEKSGVAVTGGSFDVLYDNRIEECGVGIYIEGFECTIRNNCIVRSGTRAIVVAAKSKADAFHRTNTLVEMNTFIDSGIKTGAPDPGDILLDTDSHCVIRGNVFDGQGAPYISHAVAGGRSGKILAEDNKVGGSTKTADGCTRMEFSFFGRQAGNFGNNAGYGASGWMAEGSVIPSQERTDDTAYSPGDYHNADYFEKHGGAKQSSFGDLFVNALRETEDEEADDDVSEDRAGNGMIDFSDWDL